ncbi:hypothetical protein [Enterococcus pallens]|uniref:hypothetical protein n=1 Tax=Enterococcus pallens TaxID=160454 RepID=UPI0003A50843|nr:hypothetical protein [Enterococcus pallens]
MNLKQANLGITITATILLFFFCLSLFTSNWYFLVGATGALAMLFYYIASRVAAKKKSS